MKPPSVIFVLLLLATGLIDLALYGVSASGGGRNEYRALLFLSPLASQATLLGIWLGIGAASWPARALVTAVVTTMGIVARDNFGRFDSEVPTFIVMWTLGVAILSSLASMAGFRWINSPRVQWTNEISRARQRGQFSLISLLGLTTLVAVFMAFSRYLRLETGHYVVMAIVLLINAGIGVGAMSVVFWATTRLGAFALLLGVAASVGLLFDVLFTGTPIVCFHVVLSTVFLTGWLAVARIGGTRIVRLGRQLPPD